MTLCTSNPAKDGNNFSSRTKPRSPLKAIQILLPIWGRSYIKQFLEFGLPTLLGPGNLPFLASVHPCKVVFLTSVQDANVLRTHPACRYLASICDVEVQFIDDLIALQNYSLAITRAYARAIAVTGTQVLDTCFFFLIADYVFADGALKNVLLRMQAGADAVLAGNFQVVKEAASLDFYAQFDHGSREFSIHPRDLAKWALEHLHPIVTGNMVNLPITMNKRANRLFWMVDKTTLLGCFYLMHMICIRPEVRSFYVGSSCDYSFVPELCPSGRVHVMTDSDEYLVVEMQPELHEHHFLEVGPFKEQELATNLSQWTTAQHRQNSRNMVIFHADEMPPRFSEAKASAQAFVEKVNGYLISKPKPFRGHPYWASPTLHYEAVDIRKDARVGDQCVVVERETGKPSRSSQALISWKNSIFGKPPHVRPWHPRWPDYQMIYSVIRPLFSNDGGKTLIVSRRPESFARWFPHFNVTTFSTEQLLHGDEHLGNTVAGGFEGCLLEIGDDELDKYRAYTEKIRPLLKMNAFLFIVCLNGRGVRIAPGFNRKLIGAAPLFVDFASSFLTVSLVPMTWWRSAPLSIAAMLEAGIRRHPLLYWPLAIAVGGFVVGASLVGNLLAAKPKWGERRRPEYSSIGILVRPAGRRDCPQKIDTIDDLYAFADRYRDCATKGEIRVRPT